MQQKIHASRVPVAQRLGEHLHVEPRRVVCAQSRLLAGERLQRSVRSRPKRAAASASRLVCDQRHDARVRIIYSSVRVQPVYANMS